MLESESKFEIVCFDGLDDPEDISRASKWSKYFYLCVVVSFAMHLTALSSVWSAVMPDLRQQFGVSQVVVDLGVSLYILCLALGSLVFAPLSEFVGRKVVYTVSLVLCVAFQFLTAFGTTFASMLIGRVLTAFFGSAFINNIAGTATDLFGQKDMGIPTMLVTAVPFIGPGLGPFLGSFITVSLGFRWVFYIFVIWGAVAAAVIIALIPETYQPVLLVRKAKRLRAVTGNQRYRAPLEISDRHVLSVMATHMSRPFMLLMFEPMNMVLCVYTGFLLAIVYFFFVAFPFIYESVYGFERQFVGLTIFSLSVGTIIAALLYWPVFELTVRPRLIRSNHGQDEPEFGLPALCVSSLLITAALFTIAWTTRPSVHCVVPICASGVFGIGAFWGFHSVLAFTMISYRRYSASAMATNTLVRSIMAGAFPLFGRQMLEALQIHWGLTLMAFVALALSPAGFILFRYGARIRKRSFYATC